MRNWCITGGTGTLGRAVVGELIRRKAADRIVVFSRDEAKHAAMRRAFGPDDRLRFFIGDVRDKERLRRAFEGVDVVLHAAALKHVLVAEQNPREAVLTNVFGSLNVCEAALDAGVSRVVAVSTDKAVAPVNLYGATKLVMERLVLAYNAYVGARSALFACVRYGNVMGSRGSVLRVWHEQAEAGGPLTVTDPNATRFWITLEDAAAFVVRAALKAEAGEVHVPKLRTARVCNLHLAAHPSIPVVYTGLGVGEKMHEELIAPDELLRTAEVDGHYIVNPSPRRDAPRTKLIRYASDTVERIGHQELARLCAEVEAA